MLRKWREARPMRAASPRGRAAPGDGRAVVAAAAARLDIPEANLVQLAHRWWHGASLPAARLDRVFGAYMSAGHVPPWLRHYAREVLRSKLGDPDSRQRLGLEHAQAVPARARHGWLVIPSTVALMIAIVALCIGGGPSQPAAEVAPGPAAPLSCTAGGPGLAAVETLGYAFAGRRRPACPPAFPGAAAGRATSREDG